MLQVFPSGCGVLIRLSKCAPAWGAGVVVTWANTAHAGVFPDTFPAARAGFAQGEPVVLDLGGFFCYKMLFLSKAFTCVLEVLAKETGESLGKPFLPSSKQSGLFPALPLGASMPGGAVAPAGQLLAALMGP